MMKRFVLSISPWWDAGYCFDDFVGDFDSECEALQWCEENIPHRCNMEEIIRIVDLQERLKRTAVFRFDKGISGSFVYVWASEWKLLTDDGWDTMVVPELLEKHEKHLQALQSIPVSVPPPQKRN
jgi:hypothetical protein